MDYLEALRRLAINDEHFTKECVPDGRVKPNTLDPKTLALVRIAALVAVGGAVPSYGAEVDAAVGAGATAAEIVCVLVSATTLVGLPSVVAAAPSLAMALGYDVDAAQNVSPPGDLGYAPSRPTVVAHRTASLREETPSFR